MPKELTTEQIKILLRLYEMTYGISLKKEHAKGKNKRSYIIVDEAKKCQLCDEREVLERAHIIPFKITKDIHVEGDIKPLKFLSHVISMCPTHHKKYDKYCLSPTDKEYIRKLIKVNRYDQYFIAMLEGIEILKPSNQMDVQLEVAWRWWREYIYGD